MKGGSPISWEDQEASIERSWAEYSATGVPMVVNCVTGWDQRPRLERSKMTDGGSETAEDAPYDYTTVPTPRQLTAHLQAGTDFTAKHPIICPSHALLIYSWDECDEGGNAIIPSYSHGRPNTSVLKALSRVAW
jgi:hypothetical protein